MLLLNKLQAISRAINERRQLDHGWEVELRCPKCGTVAAPVFNGWTPNLNIGFGKTPAIFAKVNCPECETDLKKVAGEKLVELFAGISIASKIRNLIGGSVLLTALFLICLGGKIWMWHPVFNWLFPVIFLVFVSSSFWMSKYFQAPRRKCACGNPRYKFMGMLGRSSCFRCSSCGRLLRIPD